MKNKTEVYEVRPKDFLEQVEVATVFVEAKKKFLILKNSGDKADPHVWSIPGGKLESKENPVEGAIRELREETGIEVPLKSSLQIVGKLYIRKPTIDFILHLFSLQLEDVPTIQLSHEHSESLWTTKTMIGDLPLLVGAKTIIDFYDRQNSIVLRKLQKEDVETIAKTFDFSWTTLEDSHKKWIRYFKEQEQEIRTVWIFEKKNCFIGYGSLLYFSQYSYFNTKKIPEINDLWITENYRKNGLGNRIVNHLENIAKEKGSSILGIGVGLYKQYGAAQKLYATLNYIPDGNGITYKGIAVTPGETYPIDDELIIWLTKEL